MEDVLEKTFFCEVYTLIHYKTIKKFVLIFIIVIQLHTLQIYHFQKVTSPFFIHQ